MCSIRIHGQRASGKKQQPQQMPVHEHKTQLYMYAERASARTHNAMIQIASTTIIIYEPHFDMAFFLALLHIKSLACHTTNQPGVSFVNAFVFVARCFTSIGFFSIWFSGEHSIIPFWFMLAEKLPISKFEKWSRKKQQQNKTTEESRFGWCNFSHSLQHR